MDKTIMNKNTRNASFLIADDHRTLRGCLRNQLKADPGYQVVGESRQQGGSGQRHAFGLTLRELQVARAIVAGYSNKEIAQQCSIGEQTVKRHLACIFKKLGVCNRFELALFTVAHHLLDGPLSSLNGERPRRTTDSPIGTPLNGSGAPYSKTKDLVQDTV
jgi:DNA-binding NarL/FixJ family response regulator